MSRKEKIVWYIIWILGIAIVSFLMVITLAGPRVWPVALLVSWTAVCFQVPLLMLLRKRAKHLRGEVTTDERIKMIRRNASDWSATIFVAICWLACLILFVICKKQGKEVITIRVEWLWWFMVASIFVLSMSTTIIIRVLRGREPKDGEN